MRVGVCHFCSRPVYPSKGITFVRLDSRSFSFCRSKCHKNFVMKRNPRKLKWTKSFRKAAGKEMVVDTTLTFAQRRNVPVRYNRDLVAATLKAMERVAEIRARRERVFYKKRMAGNVAKQRAANRKLVAENEHLLPKMRASERKRLEELGLEAEEVEREELEQARERKAEVFGKIKQRQRAKKRVRVDGEEDEDLEDDEDGMEIDG